jgi:hypothetical protein
VPPASVTAPPLHPSPIPAARRPALLGALMPPPRIDADPAAVAPGADACLRHCTRRRLRPRAARPGAVAVPMPTPRIAATAPGPGRAPPPRRAAAAASAKLLLQIKTGATEAVQPTAVHDISLAELVLKFMEHADTYYVDGATKEPTSEVLAITAAFRPLTRPRTPMRELNKLKRMPSTLSLLASRKSSNVHARVIRAFCHTSAGP